MRWVAWSSEAPPCLSQRQRDIPAPPAWACHPAALARPLKDHLWAGQVDEVIFALQGHADRLGPPQATDGPEHPRRVPANNVGYFTTHRRHMDYPTYRRKVGRLARASRNQPSSCSTSG